MWFVCNHRCFTSTFISLQREQGLSQLRIFIAIKANFYSQPLFVTPHRGRRCRLSLAVAELKTVTETGNGFNRVGLPLSALPQQAWRIIQDYRACLWSATQGVWPTFHLVLPVMYGSERNENEEVKLGLLPSLSHVGNEGKKRAGNVCSVKKKSSFDSFSL